MYKSFNLKKFYSHFPAKFKKKSIIFIILLVFSSLLETLSIGLIFPVIEFIINGNFPNNFLGFDFNTFLINKDNFILNFIIFIILLYLFKTVFLVLFNYWQLKFSRNIFKYLSTDLFKKYLFSPISLYHKKNSAVLLRNVWMECLNYGNCIDILLKLGAEILIVFFLISLLIIIEPIITLIILAILIFFIFIFYLITFKKIYIFGERKVHSSEKAFKILAESFNGIRDIKISATEFSFIENYKKILSKFVKSGNYQMAIIQSPRIIFEFIIISLILFSLLVFIDSGNKSFDFLTLLSIYAVSALKLIPGVMRILSMVQTLKGLQPSIDMLDKEFENNEILIRRDVEKKSKQFEFAKSIKIKNISFSYDNQKFILENFSISIQKNKIIGISGKSGSGKSTLVDILTGLLKPDKGHILIDDKFDINDGNLLSWQKKIGYVSQNVFLLDDTIVNNIGFGLSDEKIDFSKVYQVLKDVRLYDYFDSQKNKFQTIVGERGVRLSGGQAQRIGIARELYSDPELMVFDESTSALDFNTEDQILDCIKNLSKDITFILVSHRENTLKICDEVIYIDEINKS